MENGCLSGIRIGCIMTGSFCTFKKAFAVMEKLAAEGAQLYPIMSQAAYETDTRFFSAEEARETLSRICGREIWHTLPQVEPIGPKKLLDAALVMPCTGNTLAKIALGITDTCAVMAVKSHLRNGGPVVLVLATNDGLARSAANIGKLMNMKNIYITPFAQDDFRGKPASVMSDFEKTGETILEALKGRQIQPVTI